MRITDFFRGDSPVAFQAGAYNKKLFLPFILYILCIHVNIPVTVRNIPA